MYGAKNTTAQDQTWPNPRESGIRPKTPLLRLTDITPEEWAALPYRVNTKNKERKVHFTSRGLACRSKSEMGILNEYDGFRIFFHYDEVITIDGEELSPDIIGCRMDGTLIYHEHLGLQDEPYRQKYIRKEYIYSKAGIKHGKNLIYTYDSESGGLNMRLVREIIKDAYRL